MCMEAASVADQNVAVPTAVAGKAFVAPAAGTDAEIDFAAAALAVLVAAGFLSAAILFRGIHFPSCLKVVE